MAVYYDPDLKMPTISVNVQNNNTILDKVGSTSPLSWDADYINPDNLTYTVEVMGPDGTMETFDETGKGMSYAPLEPGKHRWWVTAKADGLSTRSIMMAFTFQPGFALVNMPASGQIPYGSEVAMVVNVVNGLETDAEFTITIVSGNGLEITDGGVFTVPAGGEFNNTLIINGSAAPVGGQSVKLLLTDGFGRSEEYALTIAVLAAPEVAGDPEPEEETDMLPIIIAAIVGIIIIIAIGFIISRRKEEEKEEEEEDIPDYDDEYDPTGKVVEGGTGSEHTILTAPGMLGGEEELRARGSNVLELTIPGPEEEEEAPPVKRKRKAATRRPRKAAVKKRVKPKRRKMEAPEEVTEEIKVFNEDDLEEFSEDEIEEFEELEEFEE